MEEKAQAIERNTKKPLLPMIKKEIKSINTDIKASFDKKNIETACSSSLSSPVSAREMPKMKKSISLKSIDFKSELKDKKKQISPCESLSKIVTEAESISETQLTTEPFELQFDINIPTLK